MQRTADYLIIFLRLSFLIYTYESEQLIDNISHYSKGFQFLIRDIWYICGYIYVKKMDSSVCWQVFSLSTMQKLSFTIRDIGTGNRERFHAASPPIRVFVYARECVRVCVWNVGKVNATPTECNVAGATTPEIASSWNRRGRQGGEACTRCLARVPIVFTVVM